MTDAPENGICDLPDDIFFGFERDDAMSIVTKLKPPSIAERMMRLFPASQRAHATYNLDASTHKRRADGKLMVPYWTVHEPVTLDLWKRHLAGKYPLVPGLACDDGTSGVSVVDVDQYEMDCTTLVRTIKGSKLPFYVRPSKSGGAHVVAFHDMPIPMAEATAVAEGMTRCLGLTKVEFFPKPQNPDPTVLPKGLNMPYLGDAGGFIRPGSKGGEMLVEEFLQNVVRLTAEQRAAIIKTKKPKQEQPTSDDAGRKYAEGKLRRYENELKNATSEGNIKLNERAYWMGQMVCRGWIEREKIRDTFRAAITHWDELPKHHKTLDDAISDGEKHPHADLTGEVDPNIRATPYVHVAPNLLKPRGSVYKGYIRKYTSMAIASTKVGKSSKSIVEALAIVTKRPLLGIMPHAQYRVWYWNGEDPLDEINKRVAAAMKHYKITAEDIDSRLFIDSGREMPIKIAEIGKNGTTVAVPVVKGVIEALNDNKIDVFIGDPFVSTHRVTENDNNAIQQVAEQWAFIADTTNTALRYNHHTRKTYGEDADFESQRGASSNYAAVRYAEVLNYMSEKEAKDIEMNPARRKFYFREDYESNLYPPAAENAVWYEKVSVDLENAADGFESDKIGVVVPWDYPQPGSSTITPDQQARIMQALRGRENWRADVQANDWIGKPIAEVLGLNLNSRPVRKQVQGVIDTLQQWKQIWPVTIKVHREDKEGYTAHPLQRDMEWI